MKSELDRQSPAQVAHSFHESWYFFFFFCFFFLSPFSFFFLSPFFFFFFFFFCFFFFFVFVFFFFFLIFFYFFLSPLSSALLRYPISKARLRSRIACTLRSRLLFQAWLSQTQLELLTSQKSWHLDLTDTTKLVPYVRCSTRAPDHILILIRQSLLGNVIQLIFTRGRYDKASYAQIL